MTLNQVFKAIRVGTCGFVGRLEHGFLKLLCSLRKKTHPITCLEADVKGFTNAAGAGMRRSGLLHTALLWVHCPGWYGTATA